MKDIITKVIELNPYIGTCIVFEEQTFEYWDEGVTRYVFKNADQSKVIKIPKNAGFRHFNPDEFERYENATEEDRDKMALTELRDGVIIQEFVMPIKWGGKSLTIAQEFFARSCRNEVGWNSEGELVCFDLDEYKKY